MKRWLSLVAVLMMIGLAPLSAAASPADHLGAGGQLTPPACGNGTLVINVVHTVVNDLDSGFNGGWAADAYSRHIQVWQLDATTFCAVTDYHGKFTTIAGATSPAEGSTNVFASSVTGTMDGGYRSTVFTGTLNPNPAYATRGNLGAFDYQLGANNWSWVSAYFTSTSGFGEAWWGWQYKYKTQRWINSSDGNSGDITG